MTSKATCIWFIIASLLRASFGANEIGCWNDGEDRAMQGAFFEDWWTMTLDSCQQFCYDHGFRYAGAENGHECYCDDWYWKHGGADHCITPCSGDWGIMCGGGWALTVMDTGYSPCNNNPCVNGGKCVANGRSYSCSCPAPWAGTNCEIYVNPCNNRPCANGGACTPAGAGFSCSCVAPYSGSTCQTYNDPCANRPCANGGVCRASGATYSCSCVAPYSGTTCQTYNDPCANKPCANGGACKASGASYTCTCVAPYSGTTCLTYVDPCANKPCANGGVCTASGATFTCTCVAPYTGTTCQTYVDPCENGPCSNGGSCKSSGASYTCSCTALFNGTNCETMRVACLDDIQVSYYNDSKEVPPPPPNTISDVNGGSSDINKNMRGAYVWLVPVWKSSSSQVVTDIQLRIESSSVAGYSNLVEGAAGGFRYLQLTRSDATSTCINNVALWRTSSSTNLPSQQGWQHCTSNINEGRGGDYLFLCWAFV